MTHFPFINRSSVFSGCCPLRRHCCPLSESASDADLFAHDVVDTSVTLLPTRSAQRIASAKAVTAIHLLAHPQHRIDRQPERPLSGSQLLQEQFEDRR